MDRSKKNERNAADAWLQGGNHTGNGGAKPSRPEQLLREVRHKVDGLAEALTEQRQLEEAMRLRHEDLVRAQADLARATAHIRDLYEHAPVGYLTLDQSGKVLDANHTAAMMLGVSLSRLARMRFESFVEPQSLPVFQAHHRAAFAERRRQTCEVRVRARVGRLLELRLESAAYRDNESDAPAFCRTALLDITGEKEARGWQVVAERLEKMVEELPIAAVFVEGDRLELNRQAEELTGYRRGELACVDAWFERLFVSKAAELRAAHRELRDQGFKEPSATLAIQRKDGSARMVRVVGHLMEGREIWLVHDLTDRLRAEEDARRTHFMIDHSREAVFWVNRHGALGFVNRSACALSGYSRDELLNMRILDLALNWPEQEWGQWWRRLCEEGYFLIERRFRSKSGTLIPISLAASHHRFQGEEFACVFVRDLSERRRAEADQARLAALVASSSAAIVAMDLEGRIQHWNPAAEALLGYSALEVVGEEAAVLVPSEKKEELGELLAMIHLGEPPRQIETVRLHKSGERVDVALTISLIRRSDGEIIGYSAILHDIRGRKQLERQVAAAAEAEQERIAMELHDGLGSLLTVIDCRVTSFSRLLEKKGRHVEAREAQGIALEIRDAIKQLRLMASGLQPLNGDPEGLVLALRDLASRTARAGRLQCRFLPPKRPLEIPDPPTANHLLSIAREAVQNAVRHSGGTRVTIQLTERDGLAALSVTDNGKGFPAGEVRSSGMGIGTMNCRARLIGWKLWIQRRADGGTRVICQAGRPAAR